MSAHDRSSPPARRRQVDLQVIAEWVGEGDRVLDLGCGRGVMLEYLKQKKNVYGVGVDIDLEKILSCVKRGVSAYQGDIQAILATFGDNAFDRVLISRTIEQLHDADGTLREALRVGRRVTVGFINYGFWVNRVNLLVRGRRTRNEVYKKPWYESLPANHFTISEFEDYCLDRGVRIHRKVMLGGDWKTPCWYLPNLFAGYALFDLERGETAPAKD